MRGSRVLVAAMTCAMLAPAAPALGAAGDLDPSFGGDGLVTTNLTPGSDAASDVAIQADGKIVVAGRTGGGGGQIVVARYTTRGRLDQTWSGDGIARTNLSRGADEASGLVIQPDGRIVVAATVDEGGNSRFAIVRYDPDGSLDQTFSRDGRVETSVPGGGRAAAVALQADGKIVVAGTANVHFGEFAAVRYFRSGAPDPGFNGDGKVVASVSGSFDIAQAVAVQGNGKIVLAGLAGNAGRFGFVRLMPNGSLDSTFGGDGKVVPIPIGFATAVAVQPNGKIVAAGAGMNGSFGLVRLNGDGTPDAGFGTGGSTRFKFSTGADTAQALALQPDGKLVAAGVSGLGGGRRIRLAVARLTTAGALDPSFAGDGRRMTDVTPGDDEANGVAIQADGRIVVAGFAGGHGGRLALARYLG